MNRHYILYLLILVVLAALILLAWQVETPAWDNCQQQAMYVRCTERLQK